MPTQTNRGNPGSSRAISTDWLMEVFDWDTDVPASEGGEIGVSELAKQLGSLNPMGNPGDSKAYAFMNSELLLAASKPFGLPNMPSSPEDVAKAAMSAITSYHKKLGGRTQIKEILDRYTGSGNLRKGLVSLSFARGKSRIDNQCLAVVVGPLPEEVRSGNWAIVRSVEQNQDGLVTMVRFIGQIHHISSDITMLENGAIVQKNMIRIHEWSHLLLTPVSFDLRWGYGQTAMGQTSSFMNSVNVLADPTAKTIDLVAGQMNPYIAAENIFALVGMLNADSSAKAGNLGQYSVAMTLPYLPREFLKALGSDASPTNPFVNGFATLITGRQTEPSNNTGDWDGFFGGSVTFDDYWQTYNNFDGDMANQPVCDGIFVGAQFGYTSVWDAMTKMCDSVFNEVYTDMIYEKDSDGQISSYPVVVVRGKPFRSDAAEAAAGLSVSGFGDNTTDMYKTWTRYEDVPRITLDSTLIVSMSFVNTMDTTPTYFTMGYNSQQKDSRGNYMQAFQLASAYRNSPEMLRFGGSEQAMSSLYSYANVGEELAWIDTRSQLGRVWFGYNYRMANGHLRIKDNGIPLSIGMNLQFDIGEQTIVVHIDEISVDFSIDPRGIKQTFTTIGFSRMMRVDPESDSGIDLIFLSPSFFGNPYPDKDKEITGLKDLPGVPTGAGERQS